MRDYRFPRSFLGDLAACLLATLLIAVFALGTFGLEFGSAEEGPLETVQEWFLAGSVVFLALSAWRQPAGAPRLASLSGAILVAVFFFRELEPVGDGPIATYLQSETFRLHEVIAIAVLAAVIAPRNIRFVPEILRWAFSRSIWPFALAAILLVVAEAIDGRHSIWGTDWLPRAIEETIETFVYALLLACSARWHAIARRGSAVSDVRAPASIDGNGRRSA